MHHGVAILSRIAAGRSQAATTGRTMAKRATSARCLPCGIRLENVYVPAGGDIPDRTVNPKFGQKLDFIERMTRWSEGLREPTLIVGDFNVAPLECDVWSHKALVNVVSHTPVEIEALDRLQQAHDWVDIGRSFVPAPERCFTWWSYRSPDCTRNDRGRRLDHMWASPAAGGAGHRASRARAVPQLGAAVRPCAADLRDRLLSDADSVERAIAALQGRARRSRSAPRPTSASWRSRPRRPECCSLLDPGRERADC